MSSESITTGMWEIHKDKPLPEKAGKESPRFKLIKNSIFLSGLSVFSQLYLFQPLLPQLCRQFHISPAHSSWAVSATTIGMAAGLFIFSFYADRLSRKRLMSFAMIASSLLTLLTAAIPQFDLFICVNFFKGLLLSGVSAVALAYLSEEVETKVIGLAISLYLSGNALGGMAGRIAASFLASWLGWRWAVVIIGANSLVLGILFIKWLPASHFFTPQTQTIKRKVHQMTLFIRHPFMIRIYIAAVFFMGSFVSVYNYLGFRLEAPPFELPHFIISSIFIMYTTGIIGTMIAGKWSDRMSPARLIKGFILIMVIGLLLLLIPNLIAVIIGLGIFTFGFFAAHTMASRIISQLAREGKSTATSLYWLFYYAGSSFIGTGTGVILSKWNWEVLILCLLFVIILALLLVRKITVRP